MSAWVRFAGLFVLAAAGVACAPPAGSSSEDAELTSASDTSSIEPMPARPSPTVSGPASPARRYSCGSSPGPSREENVCWRWHCDGDPRAASSWSGDGATCNAGGLDPSAADHALRRINVHRFLADLPPFAQEPAWSAAAQQCALIAHANGKLSHEPPKDWACWSPTGARMSEGSLIANVALAPSIGAYIEDPGNETTMVHRRWLLDETLASVGFGSTDRYSCVVVDGRSVSKPTAAKPASVRGWSAWPPAGPVPFEVFEDEKLDTAGWTVQSTKNDLAKATVEVSSDGKDLPVVVTHLTDSLGSRTAIRFVPQGWVTEAGRSYAVAVTGSARTIEFEVKPIACIE